jgi:Beta-propeller repeat
LAYANQNIKIAGGFYWRDLVESLVVVRDYVCLKIFFLSLLHLCRRTDNNHQGQAMCLKATNSLVLFFIALLCFSCGDGQNTLEPDSAVNAGFHDPGDGISGGSPYAFHSNHFGFHSLISSKKAPVIFNNLGIVISAKGQNDGWEWSYKTTAFGRQETLNRVGDPAPHWVDGANFYLSPHLASEILLYDHEGMNEWYANSSEGMKQGFDIPRRPEGEGFLIIEGIVAGSMKARLEDEGAAIIFSTRDRDRIRYANLFVVDDENREHDSFLEIEPFEDGTILRLVVDDAEAVYPIHVDPLVTVIMAEWVQRFNGPDNDEDIGNALDVDDQGNVYITGYTETYFIGTDFVTIKYDIDGNQIWCNYYDGTGIIDYDRGMDIVVDANRNTYVTGESIEFLNYYDYRTIKYDSAGAIAWSVRYDGTGYYIYPDRARAIALGPNGDVHVAGYSWDREYDYATVKYDSATGNQIWATRYDHTDHREDIALDIAVDALGNVYVTGQSESVTSRHDLTTVKYDADGQEQWIRRFNGSDNHHDRGAAVHVDDAGFIYVAGTSRNASSGDDYTTIKYSTDGAEQWVEYYDYGGEDRVTDMVVTGAGEVYVVGYSEGPGTDNDYAVVTYDADGHEQWTARYTSHGSNDDRASAVAVDDLGFVFVTGYAQVQGAGNDYTTISYDPDGNEQWVIHYDGPSSGRDEANAIGVDNMGAIFVTGESASVSTREDIVTIKYFDCDGCAIDGVCYPNGEVNPDNPCEICDIAVSEVSWSNLDGVVCDDDEFCNGDDTCLGGLCSVHAGDPCDDDGLYCNGGEVCNEDTDQCDHIEQPDCSDDGVFCNGDEFCNEDIDDCDHQNPPECTDDGVFCNGEEFCDEDSDACNSQNAPDCSDNLLWCDGEEYCDEDTDQCDHRNAPNCVDDGFWCNGEEYCDEDTDQCDSQNIPDCPDDALYCNGEEYCNEDIDDCDHQNPPECPDDGLFCTGEEFCDEDNDQCGQRDTPDCADDGLWCNGEEYCDEDEDDCSHTSSAELTCPDDGLWCNDVESCDEDADQCVHSMTPQDRCPDDGVWCNGDEQCDDAIDECINSSTPELTCPDDEQWCNGDESCDEDLDECGHSMTPEELCPDDELWCNGAEICDEELDQCDHASTPEETCPDDELWCNGLESCDEELDACAHSTTPEELCPDDELFCNGVEICDEDTDECVGSGNPCEFPLECDEESGQCVDPVGNDDDTEMTDDDDSFTLAPGDPEVEPDDGDAWEDGKLSGGCCAYD